MKFIIISAVFPPEPVVSARTSYSLVAGLIGENHSVEVITNFPNRPEGKIYEGYKRIFFSPERCPDGYVINRCFSTFSRSSSVISRLCENISFGLTSSFCLLFSKKPNVVYCNSWPIFATGITIAVSKLRRIPIVISIQDIYPESLFVQSRISEHHILFTLLLIIDNWIAKQANALIFISKKQFTEYLSSRNIKFDKAHIIPNWVQKDSIQLIPKHVYRNEVGISPSAFLIVYGGNIGKAAGLVSVIKALDNIQTGRRVVLLLAGSGSELIDCQVLSKKVSKIQVIFHAPWAEIDTSKVLSAADLLLLPTASSQSLVSVPSKLLSYLLAAKPILATAFPESEIAEIIQKANCGWVVLPDDPKLISSKVMELVRLDAEILNEKGRSGREYALNNFTSDKLLPKAMEIIKEIATNN